MTRGALILAAGGTTASAIQACGYVQVAGVIMLLANLAVCGGYYLNWRSNAKH